MWKEGEGYSVYNCFFAEESYHIKLQEHDMAFVSFAEASNFGDLAVQVEMTILEGDGGGLVFRAGDKDPFGYRFFVGKDFLDLNYRTEMLSKSVAIRIKLNQTYLLTAIAHSNNLLIYIDEQCVMIEQYWSVSVGKIGLMAVNYSSHTHVVFRNLQVWDLEQQGIYIEI